MWMKENLNYLPSTVKLVFFAIFLYLLRVPFLGLVILYSEVAFTEGEMWLFKNSFAKLLPAFLWILEAAFWYGALYDPIWMLTLLL